MPARPDRIVLASGNAGKLAEIARILDDMGITVVPQSEFGVSDADETGTTFVFATHDEKVIRYLRRRIHLADGQVVRDGDRFRRA